MKHAIDPATRAPFTDPITGRVIDVSTVAGRARIQQLMRARAAARARGLKPSTMANLVYQPGLQRPPGMPQNMPTLPGASCAGQCFPNVGWLGSIMTYLGANRRFAMSLNKYNQVFLPSAQPLILAHDSPSSLINACMLAVTGDATKVVAQASWPTPAADTTLSLGIAKVFGALVRITSDMFNFKYGTYRVQFLDGAVIRSEVFVRVTSLPVELIILSVNSASGLASVIPTTAGAIKFVAADNPALVPLQDFLSAETLNMKDLGDVIVNSGGVLNLR
jgi:hypothetical protein